MTDERKLEIVRQFKEEIYKRFNLNVMSDENLETVIEQMIVEKLGSEYITIEERVDIMERVYSSIRGLGVLDSIIKDDDITEVMINGPKDIFIEKAASYLKASPNRPPVRSPLPSPLPPVPFSGVRLITISPQNPIPLFFFCAKYAIL